MDTLPEDTIEIMAHYNRKVSPERYGSEEIGCAVKERASAKLSVKELRAQIDSLMDICILATQDKLKEIAKDRQGGKVI